MIRKLAIVLTTLLLLTACNPFKEKTGRVSGTLEFPGNPVLVPNAVAMITLEDVSRADAPATVVARQEIRNPGPVPVSFELVYELEDIDESASYGVRAEVRTPGRLLFTSDTHTPVLTRGAGKQAQVVMSAVSVLPTVSPRRERPVNKNPPRIRGWFRYMADAPLFRDCSSNRTWPVAMEGPYLELERAYLNSGIEPGSELLVDLEGRYLERPAMEGNKNEIKLIVNTFVSISEENDCKPAHNENLLGTYWKLIRVGERRVRGSEAQAEPHMILKNSDGAAQIQGSTGCNRFFGGFETQEERISFGRLGATLMACPDGMDTERAFLSALEAADRYAITGQTLALYRGEALLAWFEAVHLP